MWLSLTVMSMSSHTHPQNVHVESLISVMDGSTGLAAGGVAMSLCELLHRDVESLAGRHARAVRVAVHQHTRQIAVGDEQEARRQFVARRGGDSDINRSAALRRHTHAVAVG